MKKGFVDTSILADRLLKPGPSRIRAKNLLSAFSETVAPYYALKEFRMGVIENRIDAHNLLLIGGRQQLYGYIIRNAYAANKVKSVTEVLVDYEDWLSKRVRQEERIEQDELDGVSRFMGLDDEYETQIFLEQLKTSLFYGWEMRKKVVDAFIYPLECYEEMDLSVADDGSIEAGTAGCPLKKARTCPMREELLKRRNEVESLLEVIGGRKAFSRWKKPLEMAIEKKKLFNTRLCRSLGDALFVILATPDEMILTTNSKDFRPLASCLGKAVMSPEGYVLR